MVKYPNAIDNDTSIIRIDDNLSEMGSTVINQLREAVFAIEKTLGINPQGSKSNLNDRISVLIGPDGNPKAETLQAIGLATLPISNNQVGNNAGIQESKLALAFSTSSLNTRIISIQSSLSLVQDSLSEEGTNLLNHISGSVFLVDNTTPARHVASHIDINDVPTDSRDSYTWTGLLDINGNLRSVNTVAEALLEINNELVTHERSVSITHTADSIFVNSSNFSQLSNDLGNVQEVFDFLDEQESLSTGVDRATLNSNGIPRAARINDVQGDGYTINVVPLTKIQAYLSEPEQLAPRDNINNGDDIVRFIPNNTDYVFDSKFANVKVGDILRINYGNGIEGIFPIIAVRFVANSDWSVRINANNLFNIADGYDGYARIDRPKFNINTYGVLAAAGVVSNIPLQTVDSIILGSPRGAVAYGLGFDPNGINSSHYNLYLRFYPNGNPSVFYDLPAIDVSGNQGATPGYYNLDIIVENTNKKLRLSGYNYRFIAFAHAGEFGIMLADDYNGASFSIISGQLNNSSGLLEVGPYTLNVIGDAVDENDPLGFGFRRAGFASPVMSRLGIPTPYPNSIVAANNPTLVITPVGNRNYIVNGNRKDILAKPRFTEGDGYWRGFVSSIVPDVPHNTNLVTYSIPFHLDAEGLVPGKTIVIQPADNSTSIKDYGRFIIDSVSFSCGDLCQTNITVVNSIHGTGNSSQSTLPLNSNVYVYFCDDSVMFNMGNMIGADLLDPGDYHHYHEVFVSDNGKSFSVERARMARGNGGLVLGIGNIGALQWRIRNVSPKLKGERVGVSDFRYFVKLKVGSYNGTTGDFELYLTSLDGSVSGPVAYGSKNRVVRVYDKSCVNFIDIEFRENFGDATPIPLGVVAIELFQSLRENDEYFAVAGVSHTGLSFESITDLREFGTVSETNFTNSAIKFIESGDRYLHTNGVVRGFDVISNLNFKLTFRGGIALVNGAFVPVDSTSVSVPSVDGEYFICVNETGQLISVRKKTGSFSNFVDAVTFKELIDYRKDLTIISKAQVSSGILSTTDARRFIINQDTGVYTWSYSDLNINENPNNSSFITAESLMNWVNEYDIKEVVVDEVILTDYVVLNFSNNVVLKGGNYTITAAKGLIFSSGNWTIDNANITYNPINNFTPNANDVFCITDYNWGAVIIDFIPNTYELHNFGIMNSRFYSDSAQRAPFFAAYSAIGNIDNRFYNGKFINNTFTDTVVDRALCYAFVNSNPPIISRDCPYFSDILISGTKTNQRQGILVAGRAIPNEASGHKYLSMNRVLIENFTIKDNSFGFIGFDVGNWIGALETARFVIENNKTELIYSGFTATMHPITYTYSQTADYAGEYPVSFIVNNNSCYYMKLDINGFENEFRLKSYITNNIIRWWGSYLYEKLVPEATTHNFGLVVQTLENLPIIISNNHIDGIGNYTNSIHVMGSGASITNNTISNISENGYGIWNYGVSSSNRSIITGNNISKQDGVVIGGFISTAATSAVYGNSFSHANLGTWSGTPDEYGLLSDSNFNGLSGSGVSFAAYNTNQIVKLVPNLGSAIPLYHITPAPGVAVTEAENSERLLYGTPGSSQYLNKGLKKVTFEEANGWTWTWSGNGLVDSDGSVGLIIPISSIIPDRAFLTSFSVTLYFSCSWNVFSNGVYGPTNANTYPQASLELNGNVVATDNPFTGIEGPHYASFTLTYQAPEIIYGYRPTDPFAKEIVIKMNQGSSGSPLYGGWIGPIESGVQTMRIGQPFITYMY